MLDNVVVGYVCKVFVFCGQAAYGIDVAHVRACGPGAPSFGTLGCIVTCVTTRLA